MKERLIDRNIDQYIQDEILQEYPGFMDDLFLQLAGGSKQLAVGKRLCSLWVLPAINVEGNLFPFISIYFISSLQ